MVGLASLQEPLRADYFGTKAFAAIRVRAGRLPLQVFFLTYHCVPAKKHSEENQPYLVSRKAINLSHEQPNSQNVTTGKKTYCNRGRVDNSLDGNRNDRAAGPCRSCNTSRLGCPCN
jgi:hypothetical protein